MGWKLHRRLSIVYSTTPIQMFVLLSFPHPLHMETESLPPDPSRALVNLPEPKKAWRSYWLIEPLWRFMAISLMVWPMLGVYMVINHHQFSTPVAVVMPSWVPFSPGFFAPYMAMLLMTW